jgi:hypothetical protein
LAIKSAPSATTALADIQGNLVAELDWLEVALGAMELLATIST